MIFQSCGTAENNPRFITAQTFLFTAAIDPSTLIQEQSVITIYSSSTNTRNSTYTIGNAEDLDAFNATLGAGETVSLPNLNVVTYFLIQEPACPEYFTYAGNSYSNGVLVITANLFILDGAVCPADIILPGGLRYDIFSANKV